MTELLFLVASLFGLISAWDGEWTIDDIESMNHESTFQAWASAFNRNYSSAEEAIDKFRIWMDNLQLIATTNSRNLSYKFGLNQFSDMTRDEFREYLGKAKPVSFESRRIHQTSLEFDVLLDNSFTAESTASSIDWTKKGVVDAVVDQGKFCQACWAFAAVGALQCSKSIQMMKNGISGPIVPLSVQQLLDCTPYSAPDADGVSSGCLGNNAGNALLYTRDKGGLCSWNSYPEPNLYEWGVTSQCMDESCGAKYYSPSQVTGAQEGSAKSLEMALNNQCVVVMIEATSDAFQHYSSGIFDGECGLSINHEMLAVGYGTTRSNGKKFWKLQNYYGTTWYGVTLFIYVMNL